MLLQVGAHNHEHNNSKLLIDNAPTGHVVNFFLLLPTDTDLNVITGQQQLIRSYPWQGFACN